MGNVISSKTVSIAMELKGEHVNFIKEITGIENAQEAVEHFVVSCARYHLDPRDVIKDVKQDILDGYNIEVHADGVKEV